MNSPSVRLAGLISELATMPEAHSKWDWDALVELAVRQDVAPALHARLREGGVAVPALAAERLHESYLASAARNMRLLHERDRVLNALKAAKVRVVPIKGASLAEDLYGDAALRPMGDVDLWVRRPDVGAACAAMQPLGYSAVGKADRPPALQDALMGETQMFGPGGTLVELHWSIFSGEWLRHTARVDQEAIWARTTPVDGEIVRRLAPEDAVVHLCVHLAVNHQMSGIGLRTLVDLDRARRKWAVDWAVVAERARDWRVSCAVWLVLHALAELFGDPDGQLPLRELAPSGLRQSLLARFASPRMVAEGLELSNGPRRFLFLLLLADRPADAAILAYRALVPDRVWLTLRYGEPDARSWRLGLLRLRHLSNIARTREV
jgi:hypothetical protein